MGTPDFIPGSGCHAAPRRRAAERPPFAWIASPPRSGETTLATGNARGTYSRGKSSPSGAAQRNCAVATRLNSCADTTHGFHPWPRLLRRSAAEKQISKDVQFPGVLRGGVLFA